MTELSAPAPSPADIEARQDDLLRQLDALEKRIAQVLAEYAASVQSPAKPAASLGLSASSQPPVDAKAPPMALPFPVPTVAAATVLG
ncbi:MAG TPA: hypothetical protein VHY91_01890 [Pirellulales bacterium]|jgi:hypothetical protein|nr:hypothetical protein [Pirellulales bacterium]